MRKFYVTAMIGDLKVTFAAYGENIHDAWNKARRELGRVGGYVVYLTPVLN